MRFLPMPECAYVSGLGFERLAVEYQQAIYAERLLALGGLARNILSLLALV